MCSLGPGQVGHLNLGQDVSSLRFFAICGLQEGFEPFAINMQRPVTTWFSKGLPQFEAMPPEHPHYEVRTNPTQHPQICFHTSFSPQVSSPTFTLSSVNMLDHNLVEVSVRIVDSQGCLVGYQFSHSDMPNS